MTPQMWRIYLEHLYRVVSITPNVTQTLDFITLFHLLSFMLFDGQRPVCCVFLWPFFSRPGSNLFPMLILQFHHKLFHLYLVFPLLIYATYTVNPRVLLVDLSFGSLDQVSVYVFAALGSVR